MIDGEGGRDEAGVTDPAPTPIDVPVELGIELGIDLSGLMRQLADADGTTMDDAGLVTSIDALERAKAACAAAQARLTARFVETQAEAAALMYETAKTCSAGGDFDGWVAARDRARSLELPPESGPGTSPSGERRGDPGGDTMSRSRRGRAAAMTARTGVSAQVGLARRESPARGARLARACVTLVNDLPHTLAALTAGIITERRAELVVRGTSHLSPELRALVDAEVIGANLPPETDPSSSSGVTGWRDREVERRVKACADRLDPEAAVERARAAASDRRVSIRPLPDCMAVVSAVLPVEMAVAIYAALTVAADSAKANGDPRPRGQVMADTLGERVTGQAAPDGVDIELQVVITDRALFEGADTPAHVPGYGSVPARCVRDLLSRDPDPPDPDPPVPGPSGRTTKVWLRRLYTHPGTGTLVAMDSTRRLFPAGLRRYLVARDGVCRTPWCDAPIRHADHVTPHAAGGPTTDTNGQGLCVSCNLTKELDGWSSRVVDPGPTAGSTGPHTVRITTPTGHAYMSTAPAVLPGLLEPSTVPAVQGWLSPLEAALAERLAA